jgi:hypothetical protein
MLAARQPDTHAARAKWIPKTANAIAQCMKNAPARPRESPGYGRERSKEELESKGTEKGLLARIGAGHRKSMKEQGRTRVESEGEGILECT